jgi:phosphomannomutase
MTEDVARALGADAFRAPVGELNVVERMKEVGAVIGGEGNGGVIYPRVHYARDGLVAIALILEYMAKSGEAISELGRRLPRYYIQKTKMKCSKDEARKILALLKKKFRPQIKKTRGESAPYNLNLTDGLRIEWKDVWAHIRASGTEPAVRIITEAKTKKRAHALNVQIKNWARQVMKS